MITSVKMYKSHITAWGFFKNADKARKHCADTYAAALEKYGTDDLRTRKALHQLIRFCKQRQLRLSSVLPQPTRIMSINRWEHLRMLEKQFKLNPNSGEAFGEEGEEAAQLKTDAPRR